MQTDKIMIVHFLLQSAKVGVQKKEMEIQDFKDTGLIWIQPYNGNLERGSKEQHICPQWSVKLITKNKTGQNRVYGPNWTSLYGQYVNLWLNCYTNPFQ